MNYSFFIQNLLFITLFSIQTSSADLQKSLENAQNGEFASSINEFKKLSELGDASAQYYLGQSYIYGLGVKKDYTKAVQYLKLSAEQGYTYAQFDLGRMYYNGDGLDQDFVYAFMWWEIANINGLKEAYETKQMFYDDKISSKIEKAHMLAEKCINKKYKNC